MSTEAGNTPETNTGGAPRVASNASPSFWGRIAQRPYWLGLAVIIMGGVWLWGASGLRLDARYAGVGPGTFVLITGLGLLLLGLLLTFQVWRGETFEPQDAEDAAANSPMDKVAFATALVAVVLPALVMRPLGMPLTLTISFALVARALGSRRPIIDLLIGAVLTTVSFFLFRQLGLQIGRFFPPLGF